MINIFVCTCPNQSGVGAIDNPDQFEQAFVQYYIPEDPENFFTHDISMVRRQKMSISFGDIPKNYVVTNLKSVILTLISSEHISMGF